MCVCVGGGGGGKNNAKPRGMIFLSESNAAPGNCEKRPQYLIACLTNCCLI